MDLTRTSAGFLLDAIKRGELASLEVARAYCDRIESFDQSIGAFLHYDRESVLKQAAHIDERRSKGESLGVLAGLPVAIKDVICQKGVKTTCGSKILENFVPPYDAGVVEKLRAADAVFLGRLNMDEFAMGSSNENSAYKKVHNPWNLDCVPGGSSGGSAAAVAADLAPLTLGTDTGGSIRQPAGLCGVVGLKPSYGRVSRFGLVAFASSLDQIGVFGRKIEDVALGLEVIAGHDRRDSTSVARDVPPFHALVNKPIDRLKIGVPKEYFGAGLDKEIEASVRQSIAVLEKQGATVVEVSLPRSRYAIATYYLVATAEASSNLARYDGVHYGHRASKFTDVAQMYSASRGEGFGAEVKRRIMLGTFVLSAGYRDAYYTKALKVRRLIKEDFDNALEKVDVIAGPVSPTPAFKIGERSDDPLAMYLSDIYTVSANLAGLPAISIPCGLMSSGLPIGLHLQGRAFDEETLLRVANMYQSATDWHERRPNLKQSARAEGAKA